MRTWMITLFMLLIAMAGAQTFTEVSTNITPSFFGACDFADFDNDGDQDLAIIGVDNSFIDIAAIYRNDAGTFADLGVNISPMHMGAISWADYDNDGDYDLLCSGQDYGSNAFAEIYENNAGVFSLSSTTLPAGFWNSTGWGDWDNDGDIDLAYSWYAGNISYSSIFQNDGDVLTDINAGLPGLTEGSMEWADFDADGDLDLLITGTPTDFSSSPVYLFRNDDGSFVDTESGMMSCTWYNNALWDDMDSDGDQDILYVGDFGTHYHLVVYENTGSGFEFMDTGLAGVRTSNGNISMVTGDLDNDGDSDIVMTGSDQNYVGATYIYMNNGGTYSELAQSLPAYTSGTVDLTDVDNDGDLDILMIGYDSGFNADIGLFINDANSNTYTVNEAPEAPAGLTSEVVGNSVTLTWEAAFDDHTPQASLQYNLYIGSQPNTGDVVSAQSVIDPGSQSFGFHQLPKNGNCQYSLTFSMSGLPDDIYYWSVQAIDQSGMASAFSQELSFNIGNVTAVPEVESLCKVFPNPAESILEIKHAGDEVFTAEILDVEGRTVGKFENISSETGLNVSNLNPGLYMLKLKSLKQEQIHRFVKK